MIVLVLAAAAIIPAGQGFACTPTQVWDGDDPIWCAEGPHVRLSGIAAREMDGTCKPGHPCSQTDPITARDALVQLVGRAIGTSGDGHILVKGPKLSCVSSGGAGGTRTAAWCVSPVTGDLSCAMVQGGWAERWDKFWRGHRCS